MKFTVPHFRRWMPHGIVAAVLLLALMAIIVFWSPAERVTIGVEGRVVASIAGPRLSAVPFTPGDALAVRIAEATPTADGFRYDIRYMAYGPGERDLRDFLVDPAQRPPTGLPPLLVKVDALLPEDESGKLFDTEPVAIDLQTNYRLKMTLIWCFWALLLVPLMLHGRHLRRSVLTPPPPSVAERLRYLLEQAVQTDLSDEQHADLEKLLLIYWIDRLQLPPQSLVETLDQVRQHPTAGRQVNRVEAWLHQRAKPGQRNVARELLDDLNAKGSA